MVIAKKHYKLHEAAELLGQSYKPADLIYLGVHENLPIYVLAADWDVGVCTRGKTDATSNETDAAPTVWPMFRATFSDRLNGLQRLHPKTLSKFEAEPDMKGRNFIVERVDEEGFGTLYEYQLGSAAAAVCSGGVEIGTESLRVMAEDVSALQKKSKSDPDNPLTATDRRSLLTLVIAMAIGGYGYDPKKKKNATAPEVKADMEALGLSMDEETILKWVRTGAELLPVDQHKS